MSKHAVLMEKQKKKEKRGHAIWHKLQNTCINQYAIFSTNFDTRSLTQFGS